MIHALLVAALVVTILAAIALPANLAALPRLSSGEAKPGPSRWPRTSVVIPARNEAAEIERTVRSHLSSDYPDLRVLVVDDRSTDGAREILARLAREDPRLAIVTGEEPPEGWLGKPYALWLGARAADGEILLFADADVRYQPTALSEAVGELERERLDLVAVLPRLEMRGFWENVLLPFLAVAVFLGPAFLATGRRFRSLALGAGAGNLVRRRVYEAVGGHAAIRNSVVDDVRFAVEVKRAGFRVAARRAEDRAAVRIYHGFREIWIGFTKNLAWAYSGAGGALLFLLTVSVLVLSVVPAGTLAAAAIGIPISRSDALLAAVVFVGSVLLRASLAAVLSEPIWPALTHPIMAAVWTGLLGRSLFQRFVRKRLTWRGREYDARRARF